MKALILAAGLGTRLRPLTLQVPKCLVPIGGHPLLEYHLNQLKKNGVTDVLINTSYLSDQVVNYVATYCTNYPGLKITLAHEEILLGSAGTLKYNKDWFGDDDFIVLYGDNLTSINYNNLIDFHKKTGGMCTIACYYENHPEEKGVVLFDDNFLVVGFKEKPKIEEIKSKYANAGIYIFGSKIFDYLENINKSPLDFGHDVFPVLLSNQVNMFAYLMKEFLLDIGNTNNYQIANELIHEIDFLNIN